MKRKILTLALIALAAASIGAKRRSIGGARACAALKTENVVLRYAGSSSGCASGNGVACEIGETVSVDLTASGYDARCGAHQTTIRFGDATTRTVTTNGSLPSFAHQYGTAGGYLLEATVSNGHSTASTSQMVMVGSAGY
jgi:hypothetical protein